MAEGKLSTPVAIVIAGGLIGLGVFFGLRDRGREPAPSASTQAAPPPAAPSPERAPQRPAEPSPAPVPVNVLRDRVTKDVAAALEARRAALANKCWKPHAADTPPLKPGRWSFNFTFGADGAQLARGVGETRGTGSPELTRCVLEALEPINIPPPGANVVVEVPFGLP